MSNEPDATTLANHYLADTLTMKEKAPQEGVETVWERAQAQEPQCGFCELGLSCRICVMGPCRIDPFGDGPQRGVCGADADIMVARNLGRMVAAGAAAHSDHGRDLVETLLAVGEGRAPGYRITDQAKLDRLAAAAPEWYAEKAATIASYAVASGIYTVLGGNPAGPGGAPSSPTSC